MLTLAPGVEVVRGYKLVKPLGQGGFGEVWQAEAPGGFAVALKFIRLDDAHAAPELRALEVIRDIRHGHLLDIQWAVQVEDRLVIATPLCDRSLWDRFRECRAQGEVGIPADELLRYMDEAAQGLDFLNEPRIPGPDGKKTGVAHRDVKPHNIFLVAGVVRLADFGLAKILEKSRASHSGSMTPAYAPPEMFDEKVSATSDQWSLAVTYCQLRTGNLPFEGSMQYMVRAILDGQPNLSNLPDEERAAVARALSKDPKERWPSCRAFVGALKVAAAVAVGPGGKQGAAPGPQGPERPEEKSTGTAHAEDTNLESGRPSSARYATFGKEAGEEREHEGERKREIRGVARRREGAKGKKSGNWKLALVLGLFVVGIGLAVVYVQTDKGTLVVESEDPSVQVLVKKDGADVTLVDCKTKAQVAVRSGTYQLELVGGTKPLVLSTREFTLSRGGVETVRVRFLPESPSEDKQVAAADQTPLNPPLSHGAPAPRRRLEGGDGKGPLDKGGNKEVAQREPVAEAKAEPEPTPAVESPVPVPAPAPPKPPEPKAARFVVKVEPPEAQVKVTGPAAKLEGAGGERALVVERPDGAEEITIEASLEGYETVTKKISPISGETGQMRLELIALPVELGIAVEPGEAQLTVSGSGARVEGNGGKRKLLVERPDGRREVELAARLEGYEGAERKITPRPGDRREVKLVLEPLPAVYRLSLEPAEAALEVYGTGAAVKGTGSARRVEVARPDGGREVTILARIEGYRPRRESWTPRPGETKRADWSLEKLPPPAPPAAKAGEVITNSIGMKLVLIPAGEFDMGSPETEEDRSKDEGPVHRVKITKPFYLGQYEVTRGQFLAFYNETKYQTDAERDGKGGYGIEGDDAWKQKPEFSWHSWGFKQNDNHPVVNVSWNDAVAFCEWLSKKEGKEYRLPKEAEWEYACRAGTKTRYWHGDDAEGLARIANVADGTAKERFSSWTTIAARDGHVFTAPVGSYRENAFGLYDMHGNAWEWCSDWYGKDYYAQAPGTDPRGPSGGEYRVLRGGGWYFWPWFVRSALRFRNSADYRNDYTGFRVARTRIP